MRFAKLLKPVSLGILALVLAGLLTACPSSKAPGAFTLLIYATNTDRCDDGIKVEVELDKTGLSRGLPETVPEDENVYGGSSNWIWVKPGKTGGLGWYDDPYDHILPGGPVTINAWCMRTGGQAPGKSVRVFDLDDYEAPWDGVLNADFVVRDMSADPDTVSYPGYTEVVTPAPGIFDWGEWCDLGVPGDCTDIE